MIQKLSTKPTTIKTEPVEEEDEVKILSEVNSAQSTELGDIESKIEKQSNDNTFPEPKCKLTEETKVEINDDICKHANVGSESYNAGDQSYALQTSTSTTLLTNQDHEYQDLIRQYVHKKFNRIRKCNPEKEEAIQDFINNDNNDIVDTVDEEDIGSLESIIMSLNPHLECLEMEMFMLSEMKVLFEDCWKSVNFGEQAMSAYINFCAGHGALDANLWNYVFLQIR